VDPTLLPPKLSSQEREALRDGVVQPAEWALLGEEVKDVLNQQGTVALTGMEDLGNLVLDDLWKAIEAELEESKAVSLDDHGRERAFHERFVRDRSRLFLGRADE